MIINLQFLRYSLLSFSSFYIIIILLFYSLCLITIQENLELIIIWKVITWQSITLELSFYLDKFSLTFFSSVMLIRLGVIIYTASYMEAELYFFRFLFLKLSFIVSIILIIFSSNFIFVIIGWDGLGVTSFLLVIYYHNMNSINRGLLTILTNRLGDIGIIISIFYFYKIGTWNFFLTINQDLHMANFFILILFFSRITKRAQIPFRSWLPAAIAAPTPISSLVHSSTLVTAGVYLLFRTTPENFSYPIIFLSIGLLTCTIARMASLKEFDAKKIVALSTLSHLSLIIIILSLNFKNLIFTHLIFHAYFKALLFIRIGLVIHLSRNYQDRRKMRNLNSIAQLNSFRIRIAIIRLCGLPFLTGFYSKDFFLELLLLKKINFFILSLLIIISLFSFVYSYRLLLIIIQNNVKINLTWNYFNNFNYYQRYKILSIFRIFSGNLLAFFFLQNSQIVFLDYSTKITIYILIFSLMLVILWINFSKSNKSFIQTFILEIFFFTLISKSWITRKKRQFIKLIFFAESKFFEISFLKPKFNKIFFYDYLNFYEKFFPSFRFWVSWIFFIIILLIINI